MHTSLAICITEAFLKFASPKSTLSGVGEKNEDGHLAVAPTSPAAGGGYHLLLSEGFRNLASVARAIRKTPEQRFASWAWETLSRLHLHHFDQHVEMASLSDGSSDIDVIRNWKNRRRDVICEDLYLSGAMERVALGVTMNNPLACYTALQVRSFF